MSINLNIRTLSKAVLFIGIVVFTFTTNTTLNRAVLVLIAGICGLNYLGKGNYLIKKSSLVLWLLIYGLLMLLSISYSIAPMNQILSTIFSYFISCIVVFFVADNIQDMHDIDFFLHAFIVGAVAQLLYMLSVYGINIFEVIRQSETSVRIGDATSNSNTVGLSLAYGAILSVFYFIKTDKKQSVQKIIYLSLAVIFSVFSLLSGSRKALIGLLLGIFCIFFFGGNRQNIIKKISSMLIAFILVIVLYFVVKNVDVFSTVYARIELLLNGLTGKGSIDHSAANRFMYIQQGWQVFLSSPIFGKGANASTVYFDTYSHNNFIELLMNTGIIGFLIFYVPQVAYLKKIIKYTRTDDRFCLMAFMFVWLIFVGYGMVTFTEKYVLILMIIICEWTDIIIANQSVGDIDYD